MKRTRTLARTTLVGIAAAMVLCGMAATAGAAPATDPFARLASPTALSNPTFVGHDDTGASIALVFTSSDTAVAYVCDGTGEVGDWFSGPIDLASGQIELTNKNGASFSYDLAAHSGSIEIDGATSTFTLERATGAAGLFRHELKQNVIGWIVDNDGLLVGEATNSSGKTVGATSENLGTPVAQASTTVSTSAPVTTGLLKNIQCGVLAARNNFNQQQLADATAAGDQAGIDNAVGDNGVIVAKGQRAGCASFGGGTAT